MQGSIVVPSIRHMKRSATPQQTPVVVTIMSKDQARSFRDTTQVYLHTISPTNAMVPFRKYSFAEASHLGLSGTNDINDDSWQQFAIWSSLPLPADSNNWPVRHMLQLITCKNSIPAFYIITANGVCLVDPKLEVPRTLPSMLTPLLSSKQCIATYASSSEI